MIVILEGPDGSGKSTLADAISQWFSVDVYHTGNPKTKKDLLRNVEKCENLISTGSCIIDRFPAISEAVYSRVFDRPLRMDLDRDPVASSPPETPWVLIYCTSDNLAPVKGKAHKTPDWDNAVQGSLESIQEAYDSIMSQVYSRFPENVVKYDYKTPDAIEEVIQYLSLVKARQESSGDLYSQKETT